MTRPTPLQIITPELRRWIVAQAETGALPEAMISSMRASGWGEDAAIHALESTLQEHLQQRGITVPKAVAVPEPSLQDSPLTLDLGDRQVNVLLSLVQPRIVLLGGFMSDAECDELIAAATPRMRRSTTVSDGPQGEEVHEARTSNGMFFSRGENDIVRRIEARIARLVNWPIENGEGIQVLQYRPGAQYLPHYDYFNPDEVGSQRILERGGNRVATLVMYLNDPPKGGATTFPNLQLSVSPKRGNAVFFSYAQAHPSSGSLHGGAPVIEGEKWIATKWLREREYT